MNELGSLLALELGSLYGINQFRHTKDKKEKNRCRLLLAAYVILVLIVFFYVGGLVYGLCSLGLGSIVPAYLVVLSSLLILAFGLFTAGNRIFGQKGCDILVAMPIRTEMLVLSRFLSLYVEDLLLTLVIVVPGVGVYSYFVGPGFGFYLAAVMGMVLIPAIPLVISTLLGTLVLAISLRMKRKSLMQSVLMVLLVVGILVGSFGLGGMEDILTPEKLSQLAQAFGALFGKLYPPALWLGSAMAEGKVSGLLLFLLVSLAVMAAAVAVTSRSFHGILGRLRSFSARKDYALGELESRGLLKALYIREAKRYFSSSIYVTNTIIGPIMGAILAVGLAVTGVEPIQKALPVDVTELVPYAFGVVFCMMTTTAVAISMEGRQFWVVKALPIPTKTLLDSKILLNLSLMLPFYVISLVALTVATRPAPLELLWLVLIPMAMLLFSVVFGISVNLKFHSFDWEKEETVVKQSLPAALGGFAGPLLGLLLGAVLLLLPARYADLVKGLECLLVLGTTALMYRKNNEAVLRRL